MSQRRLGKSDHLPLAILLIDHSEGKTWTKTALSIMKVTSSLIFFEVFIYLEGRVIPHPLIHLPGAHSS